MLFHGLTPTSRSMICPIGGKTQLLPRKSPTHLSCTCLSAGHRISVAVVAAAAASLVLLASAIEVGVPQQPEETLSNVPQTLSSVCDAAQKDCKKRYRIQKPKTRKAETCTSKCAGTCILGGFGSPGEGPLNIRRPLVLFKDGFRSRKYCLSECSDICNLIGDGDDGP